MLLFCARQVPRFPVAAVISSHIHSDLKQYKLMILSFCKSEVQNQSYQAKVQASVGWLPLEALKSKTPSLPLPAYRRCLHTEDTVAPSSNFPASTVTSLTLPDPPVSASFVTWPSQTLTFLHLLLRPPVVTLSLPQIIQGVLFILRSLITLAKCFLSTKVTSLQVLLIRTWKSLEMCGVCHITQHSRQSRRLLTIDPW